MTSTISPATPPKVQANKRVWDWRELDAALQESSRLAKPTALAVAVLSACQRYGSRLAQLDERVVLIGGSDCIVMAYGHTAPGAGVESLEIQRNVRVFPAQGDRTTYEISTQTNGWFANKWLPINARDRGNKSVHRSTKWYYGQGGMYSPGIGPLYPDCGPACCNHDLDSTKSAINAGEGLTQDDREKACSFLDRLAAAVDPFGDAILRYSWRGLDNPPDTTATEGVSIDSWIAGRRYECVHRWVVTVRVKHPARMTNGSWHTLHDYAVHVCGPSLFHSDSDEVSYVVSLMHCGTVACNVRSVSPAQWCATRDGRAVIHSVRQWCGDHIYIPAT